MVQFSQAWTGQGRARCCTARHQPRARRRPAGQVRLQGSLRLCQLMAQDVCRPQPPTQPPLHRPSDVVAARCTSEGDQEQDAFAGQLPQDISWGPLVFEARRFVELRKKTFSGGPAGVIATCWQAQAWQTLSFIDCHSPYAEQFWSTEALGMGIFYTLNVFIMQFYLGGCAVEDAACLQATLPLAWTPMLTACSRFCHAGTLRVQLENKGDTGQMTDFANIIVAFAFFAVPVIGWLLDKKVCKQEEWMLRSHVAPCGPFRLLLAHSSPVPLMLCVTGLRHHAGDHQRTEPCEQHPPGDSKPSSPSADPDHVDGQPLLHVLQVSCMRGCTSDMSAAWWTDYPPAIATAATLQSLATSLGSRTLGSWWRRTTLSTVFLDCCR